jgi:hypothetical protein
MVVLLAEQRPQISPPELALRKGRTGIGLGGSGLPVPRL